MPVRDLDKVTMQAVLAEMESSGGKHREHPMVTAGVNKGTRAVSSYGLMPNTVFEFTKRNKAFQQTPIGQAILATNGDPEGINSITQDEESDSLIHSSLIDEQNKRIAPHMAEDDDAELANVFAHRRGVSGAINSLKDKKYLNDPYVQDYKAKRFNRINKFLKEPKS